MFYTEGVTIPEGIVVGEEYYPTGTSLPVALDLATVQIEKNIPIFFNHDSNRRIGHTIEMETDGKTLWGKGMLDSISPWIEEISKSFQAGARWQASIGTGLIEVTNKRLIRPGEKITVNGQELTGPFTLLQNAMIREISIVPAGADPKAEILLSTLSKKDTKMNFEEWAAAAGFDLAAIDEKNRAALEAMYNAQNAAAGDPALNAGCDPGDGEKKEEGLTAGCDSEGEKKDEEDLTASTDGGEAPPEEKKKEGLTASIAKPSKPSGVPPLNRAFPSLNRPAVCNTAAEKAGTRSEILQCSALMSSGISGEWLTEKGKYSKRTVDAAEKEHDTSLLFIMGEALRASGFTPDYRNPRAIVDGYRELLKGSAVSTKSFGDINAFSPIIDKQMRYKYERMESLWSKLYRKRSVNNFNKVATVDFDVLGRAKTLAENEDFPNVVLQSSGEEFAVSKQGVVASISFESQINDDMGALSILSDELLNMITDVQTDAFWTCFWGCFATNYTAGKGNKITKKLSVAGLSAAKKAFKSKKNVQGRFLNIPAKHLLVPSALEDVAQHLFDWKWGESNMSGNIHVGAYDVLTDAYMGTEGGYAGASDTGWFMIGDTARYPLGEYAVLKSYETPHIKENWYDHKDALNLRALGTIGFHAYTDNLAAVYSDGTVD